MSGKSKDNNKDYTPPAYPSIWKVSINPEVFLDDGMARSIRNSNLSFPKFIKAKTAVVALAEATSGDAFAQSGLDRSHLLISLHEELGASEAENTGFSFLGENLRFTAVRGKTFWRGKVGPFYLVATKSNRAKIWKMSLYFAPNGKTYIPPIATASAPTVRGGVSELEIIAKQLAVATTKAAFGSSKVFT